MRMRTLILVLALTLVAGIVYAADTICVPAPGSTSTGSTVGAGPSMTTTEMPQAQIPAAPCCTGPTGAGPLVAPMYVTDRYGNFVLTPSDDARLKKQGYTWQDIAYASNIAAQTGESVYDVIQWVGNGVTWPQVAVRYGIDPRRVMDTSCYPYEHSNKATKYYAPFGAGSVCPAPIVRQEVQPCPQPAAQPICPPTTEAQPICPPTTETQPSMQTVPPAPTTPSTY